VAPIKMPKTNSSENLIKYFVGENVPPNGKKEK
jgi:hypothetical protein